MDVSEAEQRLRRAASECDALAEHVVVPGATGPPLAEERGRRSSRWIAVAAAVVIVVVLGGLLAVRGTGGSDGPSPEVRSGPGAPDLGPGWRILDPASLPVEPDAWQITLERGTSAAPDDASSAGQWCLLTKSKDGSGGVCGGTWKDRAQPAVIGSPVKRAYLDPTSDLPPPPTGANVMAVAGPSDEQIVLGTGDDALPLDQIPAADTATAVIDGEPWTATAFYVQLDSDHYPDVSFARPSRPDPSSPDGTGAEPSAEDTLASWQQNVPQPVGDASGPVGTISPRESDAMDAAVSDYVIGAGFNRSDALGPELTDALRVVNAIDVTDSTGAVVGRWAGRFIPESDYSAQLHEAQARLAAFEAAN